eukprot:4179583-Prorocentrum_lima.AAC.1
MSIFAFSSVSDSGGLPKIVASPDLANCISFPINTSWSGVGGMWCSISFFFGRSTPMSSAVR